MGDDGPVPGGSAAGRRSLTSHDRGRLRTMRTIVVAGPILGVVGAAAVALAGGDGRGGLAVILLVSAAGCIVAALTGLAHAVVDEYRRAPVALRRVGWALGLVLITVLLLILLGGVAGSVA